MVLSFFAQPGGLLEAGADPQHAVSTAGLQGAKINPSISFIQDYFFSFQELGQ